MPTDSPGGPKPTNSFGEPKDFLIARDGDLDLAFSGWCLSHAEDHREDPSGFASGIAVNVYLTTSETIITHVCRWSKHEDRERTEENTVGVHYEAWRAVHWLKEDNKGRLGDLSKKAWIEACRVWEGLKGQDVERVE